MQPTDSASQHPVDQLIVRLIREEIEASPGDVQMIVERMATAPFNALPVRVPARDRGIVYSGSMLGATATSEQLHLVKRVRRERQWAEGTTLHEYFHDLRAAIRHPDAEILVYERDSDVFAATISATSDIVSADRLGADWLPNLLVVYSARHANLRTGYMFSMIQRINLPETIRWLK